MFIHKCDVCGVDKEYMEPFVIPMLSYKREDTMNGCKWEKGVFPVDVHLCPVCQKKIADYIESIRTAINLD